MKDYQTVSEALADLQQRGYTIDFNHGFDGVKLKASQFTLSPEKFQITESYRFEGDSSSDDEAVVYAFESSDGYKGFLVNGYGISADSSIDDLIRKLSFKHQVV